MIELSERFDELVDAYVDGALNGTAAIAELEQRLVAMSEDDTRELLVAFRTADLLLRAAGTVQIDHLSRLQLRVETKLAQLSKRQIDNQT